MLDTPSSELVKGTGYPLHSPVSPSLPLSASPCAITFQLDSTNGCGVICQKIWIFTNIAVRTSNTLDMYLLRFLEALLQKMFLFASVRFAFPRSVLSLTAVARVQSQVSIRRTLIEYIYIYIYIIVQSNTNFYSIILLTFKILLLISFNLITYFIFKITFILIHNIY